MGGYDCLLFKEDEDLPSKPIELWKEIKKRMFSKFGGSQREFNSIWYNEDSTFKLFWVEDSEDGDNGLWGCLDW